MNKQRIETIIQKMAERWQMAYNGVEPGQAYPEWFTEDQLGWIREVLRDEGGEEGKPSTSGAASEYWQPRR